MWTVTGTLDEASFFDDHLADVISSDVNILPPTEFHLGHVRIRWEDVGRRRAFVQALGGTVDDRLLAIKVALEQLEPHGYKQATWSFDDDLFRKTADWNDVTTKAKRLCQDGNVRILRNGYENIVAKVKGDHGTYDVEIFRQDPNSRAITGSDCTCLLPGGMVVMADGAPKPIEECHPGDRVLTASGEIGIIKRSIVSQYDGMAISLKPSGSTEKVWVTDSHPVFDSNAEIIEAGKLQKDDLVYYPRPQQTQKFVIHLMDYLDPSLFVEAEGRVWFRNKLWSSPYPSRRAKVDGPHKRSGSSLPATIEFDEKFARLVGLYLAEGSLVSTHTHEVRWHFDYEGREADLVEEVQEILSGYGLRSWVEDKTHGTVVCCASYLLVVLFQSLFGTGSRSKRIDERVMQLPSHILESLIDAWVDGDGHRGNMKVRDGIATANLMLVGQLRYLLARVGRESVIRHRLDNSSELVPGGKDLYTITWRAKGGRGQGRHFFSGDRVYQSLCVPERKHYSGPVYNLEVEGEHTYVMYPGIACHNCGWGEFQNQPRTREFTRFQNRPCSHIVAAFWTALATPIDEQLTEDQANQIGTGQAVGQGFGGESFGQPSGSPGAPVQQSFGPDEAQGFSAGPGTPPQSIPGNTGSPADVLPQYPMAGQGGAPPLQGASVPGAIGPTPLNPINYPAGPGGTFSSWKFAWHLSGEDDTMPAMNETTPEAPEAPVGPPETFVQLRHPDTATFVGRPESGLAGTETTIPAGSVGRVRGHYPGDLVEVLWMTPSKFKDHRALEPWGAVGYHFKHYLIGRPDIRGAGPEIQRR